MNTTLKSGLTSRFAKRAAAADAKSGTAKGGTTTSSNQKRPASTTIVITNKSAEKTTNPPVVSNPPQNEPSHHPVPELKLNILEQQTPAPTPTPPPVQNIPVATPRKVVWKREKVIEVDAHPILSQLDSAQKELHDVLESLLDIYGFDMEARTTTIKDIENKIKESNLNSKQRMDKLSKIINVCQKHISIIVDTEKPMEYIQSVIRSWNVCENIPLLWKINLNMWTNFLEKERLYVSKVESIVKCYQIPILKRLELGNVTGVSISNITSIFETASYIGSVARGLLNRLEAQNNYYPLIFGIGNLFKNFIKEYSQDYRIYLENLQQKLNALENLKESSPEFAHLLFINQSVSDYPDIPLDKLFRLPGEHVLKYEDTLSEIMRDFVRSVRLVLHSECTFKSISSKRPTKTCSFLVDLKPKKTNTPSLEPPLSARTSSSNRSSLALGDIVMKGMKEVMGTPNKDKNPPKEEEMKGPQGTRKKFPMIRSSTSSMEDPNIRKRAYTVGVKVGDDSEVETAPEIDLNTLKLNLKKIEAKSQNLPPPVYHESGEITKVEISDVNPIILEELKTFWISYNDLNQQTKQLEKSYSASLFLHIFKNQIKQQTEFSSHPKLEILCEGDLSFKRKSNDNDRESQNALKRRYFLFNHFLVLGIPASELKQQFEIKEADGKSYLLKHFWNLKRITILTSPEPVEGDDKIMFDISVERVFNDNRTETIMGSIISDDQFCKVFREQIDYCGTKVFGVDLMKLTKRPDTINGIPFIVHLTTNWIKDHCKEVEGIFRKSGGLVQVEDLKNRFDQGVVTKIEDELDEHVVANILKLYIREMPVPLIPYTHYSTYMDIGVKLAENVEESTILNLIIPNLVNLPKPHLYLLIYLLKFLCDMCEYSETTKMTSTNLAIVFASNILKPELETMEATLKFNNVNYLVKFMIEHVKEIVAMLPGKKEDNIQDDWIQELMRYTRSVPVYVKQNDIYANPPPPLPPPIYIPKPPEELGTNNPGAATSDPKSRKAGNKK